MDYEQLCARYYYNDGHLYNKITNGPRGVKDTLVGNIDLRGYLKAKAMGHRMYVHRIIYCLHNECGYDDISPWEIDHLNNDKLDNKIENLCLCDHWDNQQNRIDTKRNGGKRYYRDTTGKLHRIKDI